jgi:hypothetical protein
VSAAEPTKTNRTTLVVAFVLSAVVAAVAISKFRKPKSFGGGHIETLSAPRKSDDAAGRAGDLVLTGSNGGSLTVAAAPHIVGHFPVLGAIVDVGVGSPGADVSDPLIWFRTVTASGKDEVSGIDIHAPAPFDCAGGGPGVRTLGIAAGFTSEICPAAGGGFRLVSSLKSLKDGDSLVDWINVGSLPFVVDGEGSAWDTERDTTFITFARGGVAVLLTAPRMHVSRTFSHFGAETFPSPVIVRYGGERTIERVFAVVRGDVLSALALLPSSNRTVEVTFGAGRGGRVSVRDAGGREIAFGELTRGETRSVSLPPGFGTYVELRDERGIVTDARVELPGGRGRIAVQASAPRSGSLSLDYRDDKGAALPVHVLFKGLDGTADPEPLLAEGRTSPAGRSLYLLEGTTKLALAPGRYRVTASHGMAHSLSVQEVSIQMDGNASLGATLRKVVDTDGWLSADFHLHSGPSPDSVVSLSDRVASLVCEGVDLAVATDHNHITDFGPNARELGVGPRLATLSGVEITSAGTKWGHFNAYPLPLPSGAPEEGVPVYYGKRPNEMFASARDLGARVIQVNHARMEPAIGYFDLAHVDVKTGHADAVFASDFDVFEAFNGMWIETRDKVREGPVDLVALARRGKRVATTGNSDSHKLLYEEAGYPRTWVHTPPDPVDTRAERSITALLEARDTTVTSGPFVEMSVQGRNIGSVVTPSADGTVRVKVRVSAPAWVPVEHVEVWRDDTVAERFEVSGPPTDGVRFEREVAVQVGKKDAVVLAWADADAPLPDVVPYEHALSIGFTGLVFIDGNGDGSVIVPPSAP